MKKNRKDIPRRKFFCGIAEDILRITVEIRQSYMEGERTVEMLARLDEYPIAQTYPSELFEEEARRLGIDMETVGETETIRRIMEQQINIKRKQLS